MLKRRFIHEHHRCRCEDIMHGLIENSLPTRRKEKRTNISKPIISRALFPFSDVVNEKTRSLTIEFFHLFFYLQKTLFTFRKRRWNFFYVFTNFHEKRNET